MIVSGSDLNWNDLFSWKITESYKRQNIVLTAAFLDET